MPFLYVVSRQVDACLYPVSKYTNATFTLSHKMLRNPCFLRAYATQMPEITTKICTGVRCGDI